MKQSHATITSQDLRATREKLLVESTKEMAELLGVSVNTYTNWESGRRPIPLWVEKFLEALVKNLEIIEIGMMVRYHIANLLQEPRIAERLREYYPFFDLQHVISFPMVDFIFKALSTVPFSKIEGRLTDFMAEQGRALTK